VAAVVVAVATARLARAHFRAHFDILVCSDAPHLYVLDSTRTPFLPQHKTTGFAEYN
jgi:hypothetical protein